MATNERLFRYRTSLEGDAEVKRRLTEIGQAGDAGMARMEPRLEQVRQKLTQIGQASESTSQRMIAGMSAVNNASLRMVQGMSAAGQAAAALNANVANSNRALLAGAAAFGAYRFQLQNAAFQVGDLAVQLASGTNFIRAATQQGTQFLGVFGHWGAILSAAFAAVGALAIGLDTFGDSADDAAKDQETLNKRLEQMSEIMDKLQGKAEPTRAALEASRRNLIGVVDLELRQAEAALRTGEASALARSEGQGAFVTGAAEANLATLGEQRDRVRELRRELTLLRAEAGEFGDRFSGSAENAAEALKLVEEQERKTREEAERLAEQAAREAEREQERRDQARTAIEDQIDALLREGQQIEMTARNRAIDLEIQEAEETARRGNIILLDDEIERLREAAGARFDLAEASKAAEQADRDRQRAAEQAQREAERATERAAREIEKPYETAAENIQRAFGDIFTDAFDDDPVDAAERLAGKLQDIFARLAGEIAAMMVINPVLSGVGLQGFGRTGGAVGGTSFSLGGGGLNLSSLSGLLGGGTTFGSTGPRGPIGASGNPTHTGASGPAGAPSVGGAGYPFLAAGLGALAYGLPLLTGLLSGDANPQSIGQGAGGIIGSVAGGFLGLGPVGSIFGGLLGSMAGGLFGGLFGGGQNNFPKSAAYLGAGPGGLLVSTGSAQQHGGDRAAAEALRDLAMGQINALLVSAGGAFGAGGLGYGGPGGLGGFGIKNGAFYTVVGRTREDFGQDQQAAVQNFVVEILSQSIRKGLVGGISDSVARAIGAGGDYDTVAELTRDINLGRMADGLGLLSESAISFQAEMLKLQQQFEEAKARAADLGFAINDQLTEQFDNAKKALEERYVGQFRAFERDLTFGGLTNVSPEEQYRQAVAAYGGVEGRALAGDEFARSQFVGLAQQALGLGRAYYASSPEYQALHARVLAATQQLGTLPAIDIAPVVAAVANSGKEIVKAIERGNDRLALIERRLDLDAARRSVQARAGWPA